MFAEAMLVSMCIFAAFAGGQNLCRRQFEGNPLLGFHLRRGFSSLLQLPAAGGRSLFADISSTVAAALGHSVSPERQPSERWTPVFTPFDQIGGETDGVSDTRAALKLGG